MHSLDDFITAKLAANLADTTASWYRLHIVAYLNYAAGQDLEDAATVRSFLVHRRRIVSKSSANACYRALSAFFAWQVEQGALVSNPMLLIDRPKLPKRQPRAVTFEQYETMLAAIPNQSWTDARDRLMVRILFLCGIRVAELVALNVNDLDVNTRIMRVIGKGDKERLIPLAPVIGPTLLEYLVRRPGNAGAILFVSNDGSGQVRGRLTASGVRQRLRRLCERAGLPVVNPHAFRHGVALHLLNEGGADMALIQRIFGHSDIRTTQQHYAAWLTDGMISAYDEALLHAEKRRRR